MKVVLVVVERACCYHTGPSRFVRGPPHYGTYRLLQACPAVSNVQVGAWGWMVGAKRAGESESEGAESLRPCLCETRARNDVALAAAPLTAETYFGP